MNYEQRHPVRKDGKLVEGNDFLDLLQMSSEIETWKHIGSFKSQPWALICQTWAEIENSAWQMPWVFFLTWEHDLSWFICPHPQGFPSSHAKNAAVASQAERLTTWRWRPGWGGGPPPGDGPPAPSLLAAVLEPWRRSTIMDHVSHITSLTHDIIKHSGYYGSWTINGHEKTLPIKSIWKFVSFISGPPKMRIKPSNMGIYVTIKLNLIATDIQPYFITTFLVVVCCISNHLTIVFLVVVCC